MKIITTTFKEIYDLYISVTAEIQWDNGEISSDHVDILEALLKEDVESIRKYFKEGYTAFFINETLLDILDTHDIVLLYIANSSGKLVAVLVKDEMVY